MADPLGFALLLGIGLLGIGLGGYALRAGAYVRAGVSRRLHPRQFWFRVIYQTGIGSICLVGAIGKLSETEPPPAETAGDECAGYASSFDCFMGEHFQNLFFIVLAVAIPFGIAFWRWYQGRAMAAITAAADRAELEARRDPDR